jgi:DNA-binding MarR family transcriptional regulator
MRLRDEVPASASINAILLLVMLHEEGPATQRVLAQRLGMTDGGLSKLIDVLSNERETSRNRNLPRTPDTRLVHRSEPDFMRSRTISLTDKGQQVIEEFVQSTKREFQNAE